MPDLIDDYDPASRIEEPTVPAIPSRISSKPPHAKPVVMPRMTVDLDGPDRVLDNAERAKEKPSSQD